MMEDSYLFKSNQKKPPNNKSKFHTGDGFEIPLTHSRNHLDVDDGRGRYLLTESVQKSHRRPHSESRFGPEKTQPEPLLIKMHSDPEIEDPDSVEDLPEPQIEQKIEVEIEPVKKEQETKEIELKPEPIQEPVRKPIDTKQESNCFHDCPH